MSQKIIISTELKLEAQRALDNIKSIQKALSNVELAPSQKQKILDSFESLSNKTSELLRGATQGFTNSKEIEKFSINISKIKNEFGEVVKEFQSFGIDPNKIKPATEAFEKISKDLNEAIVKQKQFIDDSKRLASTNKKELKTKTAISAVEEMSTAVVEGDPTRVTDIKIKATQELNQKLAQSKITSQEELEIAKKQIELLNEQINRRVKLNERIAAAKGLANASLKDQEQYKTTVGEGTLKSQRGSLNKDVKIYENTTNDIGLVEKASGSFSTLATESSKVTLKIKEQTAALNNLTSTAITSTTKGLEDIKTHTAAAGQAFDNLGVHNKTLYDTQLGAEKSAASFDKLTNRIGQLTGATMIMSQMRRVVQGIWQDFKQLDEQFTEIAIVSDYTTQELWEGFSKVNKTAQEFGTTATNVVSVQKLYYQQGKKTAEVNKLTAETLTLARVSGLEFSQATDLMTAAINAFRIEAEDSAIVTDTWAALAAAAAADTAEIGMAMSKTASIAASAGMNISNTSVFLTKMIETTRESSENLGTALKSIIARFQELKSLQDEDDDGEIIDANKVEAALRVADIDLRDTTGQFRDLDQVFMELSSRWDGLDRNSQRYIATIAAGSRQQSRFIAMMENYDRTLELTDIANQSAGAGNYQLSKSMQSIETSLNRLKSSWQEFYSQFMKSSFFKSILDGLNGILRLLNALPAPISAVGVVLSGILAKNFLTEIAKRLNGVQAGWFKTKQIIQANPITGKIERIETVKTTTENLKEKKTKLKDSISSRKTKNPEEKELKLGAKLAYAKKEAQEELAYSTNRLIDLDNEKLQNAIKEKTITSKIIASKKAEEASLLASLGIKKQDLVLTSLQTQEESLHQALVAKGLTVDQASAQVKAYSNIQSEIGVAVQQQENAADSVGLSQDMLDIKIKEQQLALQTQQNAQLSFFALFKQALLAKDKEELALTLASIALQKKNIKENIKETASIAGLNVVKTASNALDIIKLGLSGPVGWAILTTAIGVTTAAVLTFAKISKDNNTIEEETKKAEEYSKALNENQKAIADLRSTSEKYRRGLELQDKGLSRTQEETEEYNTIISDLTESYPSLIDNLYGENKALNEGSEALAKALEQKQTLINTNLKLIRTNAQLAASYGTIIEGTGLDTANKNLQNASAFFESYEDSDINEKFDSYAVNQDDLKEGLTNLAEEGLTKGALEKITDTTFTGDEYSDFIETYKENQGKTTSEIATALGDKINGLSIDEAEAAVKVFEDLEKNTGTDLLLEYANQYTGDYQEEAKAYANKQQVQNLASMFGKTATDELTTLFAGALSESDNSEETVALINDYYSTITETEQANIESYLASISTTLKGSADSTEVKDQLIEQLSAEGISGELLSLFSDEIDTLIEDREKIILDAQKKIAVTTSGTNLSADELEGLTSSEIQEKTGGSILSDAQIELMTPEQISSFANQLAMVGEDGATAFMESYLKTFKMFEGNAEMQQVLGSVDWADQASIDKAQFQIQNFYGAGEKEALAFQEIANNSGDILEKSFTGYDDLLTNLKADVKGLTGSFDKLDDAASGTLGFEDMLSVLSESEGMLSADDFTASSEGYRLSQEKVAEVKRQMLNLQIAEYKIQLMSYDTMMASLQGKTVELELEGKSVEWSYAKLSAEYDSLRVKIASGKYLDEELVKYQNIRAAIDGLKSSEKTLILNHSTWKASVDAIEASMNYISSYSAKSAENTRSMADKLADFIDLLKDIDLYSNIDSLIGDLENEIAKIDVELELTASPEQYAKLLKSQLQSSVKLMSAYQAKTLAAEENAAKYKATLQANYGQYATFDSEGNLIQNYNKIMELSNTIANQSTDEAKESMQKQLDTLNDLIDGYNEELDVKEESNQATLDQIEYQKELQNTLLENIQTLEEKFLDLFITRDEKALESTQNRYELMKQADDDYLEAVKSNIERERDLRDKTQNYSDLEKKEKRLALLKMNTSGIYAKEIQSLEEEIAEDRQTLADQEVDNLIEKLEEEYSIKAANMDAEVTYQEQVLEYKKQNMVEYNLEIANLMAQNTTTILSYMKTLDDEYIQGTSSMQEIWIAEWTGNITAAKASMDNDLLTSLETIDSSLYNLSQTTGNFDTAVRTYVSTVNSTYQSVVGSINSIRTAYINTVSVIDAMTTAQLKYNNAVAGGSGNASSTSTSYNTSTAPAQTGLKIGDVTITNQAQYDAYKAKAAEIEQANNTWSKMVEWTLKNPSSKTISPNYSTGQQYSKNLQGYKFDDAKFTMNASKKFSAMDLSGAKVLGTRKTYTKVQRQDGSEYHFLTSELKKYAKYKEGGMVDYTGPAWVDGTPGKPEAFLDSKDTANIAALRDSLKYNPSAPNYDNASTVQKTGDSYYEIHIEVDEIADDYSVDKMIEKVEERILNVSGKGKVIQL